MPKKKLKKFRCVVYYHSFVEKVVEANDAEDALNEFRSGVTDEEICGNLIEEGTEEPEEVK